MKTIQRALMVLITALICISNLQSQTADLKVNVPRGSGVRYPASIDEMIVRIIPQGIYFEYRVYIRFSPKGSPYTKNTDSLEVEFNFTLPDKSFINDSWLWFDNVIVKAKLIDRWTAGLIYDTQVGRFHRDPSLLIKNNQSSYSLKVYPLIGDTTRRIKMNIYTPVHFSTDKIYSVSPLTFIKASFAKPRRFKIITYPNGDFQNPRFPNAVKATFQSMTDPEFGLGWSAFVDSVDFNKIDTLVWDNPLKKGPFYTLMSGSKEHFYQLALNTSSIAEIHIPRRVAVIVDWLEDKSYFTKSDIMTALKNSIDKYCRPEDQLNIFFSDSSVHKLSSAWVNTDSAGKSRIFRFLHPDSLKSYSNLTQSINSALDFIDQNADSAMIYIFASSDRVGGQDTANYLINYIKGRLKPYNPIFAGSFVYQNANVYQVGALSYWANDYLLGYLCHQTGGIYEKAHDHQNNLILLANKGFEYMFGQFNGFELQTSMPGGFTYSQFYDNYTPEKKVDINQPIIEFGKIYGTGPFYITASGFFRDQPFFKQIIIDSANTSPYSYNTETLWNARNLYTMETTLEQNNYTIHKIMYASFDARVLALYTGFLCLEPTRQDSNNVLDLDVPVELIAFNAEVVNNRVLVSWATASEENSDKFQLEKAEVLKNGDVTDYQKIYETKAAGISKNIIHYSPVADYDVIADHTYLYRLKMIDLDGSFKVTEDIQVNITQGGEADITECYPNPSSVRANFICSGTAQIPEINIYDAFGRKIEPRIYNLGGNVSIDVTSLDAGIYIVNFRTGDKTYNRKINVVK